MAENILDLCFSSFLLATFVLIYSTKMSVNKPTGNLLLGWRVTFTGAVITLVTVTVAELTGNTKKDLTVIYFTVAGAVLVFLGLIIGLVCRDKKTRV